MIYVLFTLWTLYILNKAPLHFFSKFKPPVLIQEFIFWFLKVFMYIVNYKNDVTFFSVKPRNRTRAWCTTSRWPRGMTNHPYRKRPESLPTMGFPPLLFITPRNSCDPRAIWRSITSRRSRTPPLPIHRAFNWLLATRRNRGLGIEHRESMNRWECDS